MTYELNHKYLDCSSKQEKVLKIEGAPLDAYITYWTLRAEQLLFYLSNQKLNLLMIIGIK